MEAGDRLLLKLVDDSVGASYRRAGAHMACRIGCTECCVGPFPINQLDAWRLRRGLALLDSTDRARAAAVRARARDSARAMAPFVDADAFYETHAAVPCPALDPATGSCDLYAWRPLSCRTFGPPVRIAGEDLTPCRLCFSEAPPDAVDACRAEIDPDGVEDILLDELEEAGAPPGATIVAIALAQSEPTLE